MTSVPLNTLLETLGVNDWSQRRGTNSGSLGCSGRAVSPSSVVFILWFPASFVISWGHVTDLIHSGLWTETMKAIYGSAHKTSKTSCKCIIFSLFTYQQNEDFKESRGSQNGKIEAWGPELVFRGILPQRTAWTGTPVLDFTCLIKLRL